MKASYDASQARFEALKQQRETARSQSDEAAKRAAGADATILHCEAERDMAELNLSYTVVTAPFDACTTRRKQLRLWRQRSSTCGATDRAHTFHP